MPKLPRRLPYEFLILGCLSLGSCDVLSEHSANQAYGLAHDAKVNVHTLFIRSEDIETGVRRIEDKLDM